VLAPSEPAGAVAQPDIAGRIVRRRNRVVRDLDDGGNATIPNLPTRTNVRRWPASIRMTNHPQPCRLGRHGFGRGEYKYFSYPLPDLVGGLRTAIYPHLVPIANRGSSAMGLDVRFPDQHPAFIKRCRAAGQRRPTPLLLQYGAGDYNCLHQDLYGEHVFPLRRSCCRSDRDFSGSEFVLTEQRPRMQSRAEVVPLRQGDAVIFAVHHRPVRGARGVYRVNLRHGVSRLRSGRRHTLGIIFHDAA
jgi:hypothetical protein